MSYGEGSYGSDGYLGGPVSTASVRLVATAEVSARLRYVSPGVAYFYENVGFTVVVSKEGTAYFNSNIGLQKISPKEATAYFYEFVVTGAPVSLVATADLLITQITRGRGGYGSRGYGRFRYGMGNPPAAPPPVVTTGEVELVSTATLYALPSHIIELARLSIETVTHEAPSDVVLARHSVEVVIIKPKGGWRVGVIGWN